MAAKAKVGVAWRFALMIVCPAVICAFGARTENPWWLSLGAPFVALGFMCVVPWIDCRVMLGKMGVCEFDKVADTPLEECLVRGGKRRLAEMRYEEVKVGDHVLYRSNPEAKSVLVKVLKFNPAGDCVLVEGKDLKDRTFCGNRIWVRLSACEVVSIDIIKTVRDALAITVDIERRRELARALRLPSAYLDPKRVVTCPEKVLKEMNDYLEERETINDKT